MCHMLAVFALARVWTVVMRLRCVGPNAKPAPAKVSRFLTARLAATVSGCAANHWRRAESGEQLALIFSCYLEMPLLHVPESADILRH